MNVATEFNPNTGEMGGVWYITDQKNWEINRSGDRDFVEGSFEKDSNYVDIKTVTKVVRVRPTFEPLADKSAICADGVDVLTVSQLPRGTTQLQLTGPVTDTWTETRQKTDLTINVPGRYKLKIAQWPYQDCEVEFDAT